MPLNNWKIQANRRISDASHCFFLFFFAFGLQEDWVQYQRAAKLPFPLVTIPELMTVLGVSEYLKCQTRTGFKFWQGPVTAKSFQIFSHICVTCCILTRKGDSCRYEWVQTLTAEHSFQLQAGAPCPVNSQGGLRRWKRAVYLSKNNLFNCDSVRGPSGSSRGERQEGGNHCGTDTCDCASMHGGMSIK